MMIYKIGIGLAVALLACLLPMPYGYFIFIRFAAMIIFVCFAYVFYQEKKIPLCVLAGSLALFFQPFAKIALGRVMWNVVDVVVAIGLVILFLRERE